MGIAPEPLGRYFIPALSELGLCNLDTIGTGRCLRGITSRNTLKIPHPVLSNHDGIAIHST